MLSIVIPTRNKYPYLDKTLESISNQINIPKFEVIIINNNSNDDTDTLFYKYRNKLDFSWISSHSNKIKTYNKAKDINLGVKRAKYPIITLIDSDVLLHPKFLIQTLNKIDRVDKICHNVYYLDQWTTNNILNNKININYDYKQLNRAKMRRIGKNILGNSHQTLSKELFLRVKYDESYEGYGCEDLDFNLRLSKYVKTSVVGEDCFHLFHPTNNSVDWRNPIDLARNKEKYDNLVRSFDLKIETF